MAEEGRVKLQSKKAKPRKSGRKVISMGINKEGHHFKRFDDGAYTYKNINPTTKQTISSFYDNGRGYIFYRNYLHGYWYIENKKRGTRSYRFLRRGH